MRSRRVTSFLILSLALVGLNFLQFAGFFFASDFKSEVVQTALRVRQIVEGDETIAAVENTPYTRGIDNIPWTLNNSSTQVCSREEIKTGSWTPVTLNEPPYITKTTHLRCYPKSDYENGDWKTYKWKPAAGCEFSEWDPSQFCSLMKRATVLTIGDSLSWEHFSSLGQLLGLRVHQSAQHESKLFSKNHVQLACNNQVRLVFRRDDLLTNLTEAIESTFPQVIVMNRGAHYVNDTRLVSGLQQNIEEIKAWQSKCRERNMKCHLFWRTSVPGHPLCNQVNYTGPNNNLEAMEASIANLSHYNNHTILYHWYDYQHQNELVLDILKRNLGDDFDVLDAYHLNVLRPDEHRAHQGDCLHNCYPGKMDVYSQLMLHFLKMRRDSDDVDALVDLQDRLYEKKMYNVTRK
jgi:hypothetical protein